jgi:DNA-directed RNA polymerase omega subunit
MARLTSELAAAAVGSQYDLVLIASRRVRELKRGWLPRVQCDNDLPVTALREIEAGLIGRDYLLKPRTLDRKERPPQDDAE